jgi:HEAT repeat protein
MAFHALGDIGSSAVPILIDAFRKETGPDIRAELVEIIWNHRRPEDVAFLGEALSDADPKVWKRALDGLVTIASPAALQILQTASIRELPDKKQQEEFRRWVDEAIAQL